MGADPEIKHPASPLLARWRETAPRPGTLPAAPAAQPRSGAPAPAAQPRSDVCAGAAAPPDPAVLLAEIEEAIAAAAPPEAVEIARAALDPICAALSAPASERDPAALLQAFEQAEDILEALLLAVRTPPPMEG
jgi:hypothetical protein